MGKAEKYLGRMRNNPRDDWTIDHIKTVVGHYAKQGMKLHPPSSGSHFKVTCERLPGVVLTIPAKRPLRAIYVRRFVSMIDDIISREG